MKEKRKENTDEMIKRLMAELVNISNEINNSELSSQIKSTQLDVLIHTMHFLTNYEENVKVLKNYWLNKDTKEER